MTDEKLRLFIARRIRGLISGEHTSRQLSVRGHDPEEKRKFRLGDDPRSIDALATAKRDDGNSRVGINRIERGVNLVFLIDCSASIRFGTILEKYQYAVELVRQITLACLGGGNRFRFVVFDEKIRYDSRFTMSAGSIDEFLQELVRIPADKGTTNLAVALNTLSDTVGQPSLNVPGIVFLISDFLFQADFGNKLAAVSEQSDVIAIFLKDPAELVLPRPRFGLIRLVDPETGKSFMARRTGDAVDNILPILKRCETDWLELNTGLDTGKALEKLTELFEKKKEG